MSIYFPTFLFNLKLKKAIVAYVAHLSQLAGGSAIWTPHSAWDLAPLTLSPPQIS